MPECGKAIFLSYAHEDVAEARRIAEALRGFGCEVWFDENELRGGDSWDANIRQQIKDCALFLPVISKQTNARKEGYFRREWRLAVDRTHDMAEGMPFLLPIVIDDTFEGAALVPSAFRAVHWISLPRGLPGPDFVDTVQRLLADEPAAVAPTAPRPVSTSHSSAQPSKSKIPSWALGLVAVLVVGVGAFWLGQSRESASPPSTSVATPASAETQAPAIPESAGLSIAVMPLANMSSNTENAYFAGGVHEDILTNLTHIEGMEVVSRTTALRIAAEALTLREIGQRLEVDYVVEGSVRRIGNHVRVTVQLIDARNDRHLWASNFERELVDVFATQSELAREISNSLHLEIQPETVGRLTDMPTTSVLAYDLYIKSMSLQKTEDTTKDSMLRQIDLLERAVAADPDFVEAWAVLKRRYDYMSNRGGSLTWLGDTPEDRLATAQIYRTKSDRALAKAVALDPDNVETLLSTAVNHIWPQPERVMIEQKAIFDRILTEHPDNAMGWYHLAWWYRHLTPVDDENSIQAFDEALERDPFNARIVRAVLERYRQIGDSDNQARMAERLTQIVPELAEDSSLEKDWAWRRFSNLAEAFEASADPVVVADMRRLIEDDEAWWIYGNVAHDRVWTRWYLLNVENDWAGSIATAAKQGDLESTAGPGWTRAWLNMAEFTMMDRFRSGRQGDAQGLARQIINLGEAEWFQQRTYDDTSYFMSSLASAYLVLGESEKLRELTEFMVAKEADDGFDPIGFNTIVTVALTDVNRAVDLLFKQIDEQPNWVGTDIIAVWCRHRTSLLVHPRMRELYVKQDKWLWYLAERLPEYAEFAEE